MDECIETVEDQVKLLMSSMSKFSKVLKMEATKEE